MAISNETMERIRKDAKEAVRLTEAIFLEEKMFFEEGYIKAATAEAEKALCLIEALEWYDERAKDIAIYTKIKYNHSILAVIKELELDAGKRATATFQGT